MKERKRSSRGWYRFALVALLALGIAAPAGLLLNMAVPAPASANQELHPGGRLFFPAWDVRGARLSFMIITRLALFPADQNLDGGFARTDAFYRTTNNCLPGHTDAFPGRVFTQSAPFAGLAGRGTLVDDVHLEWYGKGCSKSDELIPMSCADVDLIFLSSANIGTHASFSDLQGALDVHFTINDQGLQNPNLRVLENSLMGNAVIADPTEGWALAYPAAAAKATFCDACGRADFGTNVGYEPFPTEVFLPFALADDSQGGLQNLLYLWAPSFFPGDDMGANVGISWNWWDGRERRHTKSDGRHSFIEFLKVLDTRFKHSNFTCGHTTDPERAENDGAPLTDVAAGPPTNASAGCSGSSGTDTVHTSDNAQTNTNQKYSSTSIGWWDIRKSSDDVGTFAGYTSKKLRGLVGVVAATIPGASTGNGDAIRLWHKDPCEFGPSGDLGPPHVRDWAFQGRPNALVGFNLFSPTVQLQQCNGGGPNDFPGLIP